MTNKTKRTGRAASIPAGLAIGWAASAATMASVAVVLALLIHTQKMSMEQLGYGMTVMYLVSSFLGAEIAYSRIKHQRMLICLMAGLSHYGVLLLITGLFFGGQYEAAGITGILILLGSSAAGCLGIRQGRGGGSRRRSHGHRKVVQKFG